MSSNSSPAIKAMAEARRKSEKDKNRNLAMLQSNRIIAQNAKKHINASFSPKSSPCVSRESTPVTFDSKQQIQRVIVIDISRNTFVKPHASRWSPFTMKFAK